MSGVRIIYKHHTLRLSSISAHHIYIQPITQVQDNITNQNST